MSFVIHRNHIAMAQWYHGFRELPSQACPLNAHLTFSQSLQVWKLCVNFHKTSSSFAAELSLRTASAKPYTPKRSWRHHAFGITICGPKISWLLSSSRGCATSELIIFTSPRYPLQQIQSDSYSFMMVIKIDVHELVDTLITLEWLVDIGIYRWIFSKFIIENHWWWSKLL